MGTDKPVKAKFEDICPICGEIVHIIGKTKDGRLIGSCMDAFTEEQWLDKGIQPEDE